MFIKQLSVFMENREGRLEEVFKILSENNISISSFSLADTSDYGILRMIVSDAAFAEEVLKKNGYSARLTEVIGLKAKNGFASMYDILNIISKDYNIEYMYVSSTTKGDESVVIKTNENKSVMDLLIKEGYESAE